MPQAKARTIGKQGIFASWVVKRSDLARWLGGNWESCQTTIHTDIESESPSWLILRHVLQNIPGKGIASILGTIQGDQVVVKAQLAGAARREYEFQQRLAGFPGFMRYHCMFTCGGNKADLEAFATVHEKTKLCKTKGTGMGVIVMPYMSKGSLEDYLRTRHADKATVRRILVAVIGSVYHAYKESSFTHGDLYCKNIVLSDTYQPFVIGFERSEFGSSWKQMQFWRDLDNLLGDIGRIPAYAAVNHVARAMFVHLAYGTEPNDPNIQDVCAAIATAF